MGMLEDALREYAKYQDRTTDPTTPGTDEALVYVKNGKIHSIDDAGTVTEYGAGNGGGGSVEVIDRQVLASSQSAIPFDNIPGTYEDLRLALRGRSDRNAVSDGGIIRFNDDTTTSYHNIQLIARGTIVEGITTHEGLGRFGEYTAATGPSGAAGQTVADILGYARTDFHKQVTLDGHYLRGTGDGDRRTHRNGITWTNTAAITKIVLETSTSNQWIAGTVATLYGIN